MLRGAVGAIVVLVACERAEVGASLAPAITLPSIEVVEPAIALTNPRELPPPAPSLPKPTWFTSLTTMQRNEVREYCTLKASDPCEGMLLGPGAPRSDAATRMAALRVTFLVDFEDDDASSTSAGSARGTTAADARFRSSSR